MTGSRTLRAARRVAVLTRELACEVGKELVEAVDAKECEVGFEAAGERLDLRIGSLAMPDAPENAVGEIQPAFPVLAEEAFH